MKKRLDNKWALVTGSARGIGQQVALGLAQLGCNVIVHGRKEGNTAETLALLSDTNVEVKSVFGELDSEEGVNQVISQTQAVTADVDILYNNAAISCPSTPIFEFSMATWKQLMQVNVLALAQLCNAFGPGMKARNWGRIINLSSGIADQPNLAPYSVSKAAVDKFTKDLAFEFKDTNVRVNCIDPGWIQTDLGGPDAWDTVESTLPGMMAPVIIADSGPNGEYFRAQDYKFFD
ncbi:SDR family NAD(P)-dependent oxidoreductase [Teredinibacter purpureus]|uniref:SDR family NAD(P)-dependent oxidoreductase n=1 Tax=Teredinibacter purpureus TaxID=2731756 RepID=UPI0005F83087|nr:SDR family oxidoreductase [Teredinibacter purpureus]